MTPKENLIAARALISDASKWARHGMARDAEGRCCNWHVPRAVAWCAIGAIYKTGGREAWATEAHRLLNRQALDKRAGFPMDNDSIGHKGVLAAFDRAIASA